MNRLLAILIFALLLTACQSASQSGGIAATPAAPDTTAGQDLEKHLGEQIVLEGVLESEGSGLEARFFLVTDAKQRVEVSAWAPLEVMLSPSGIEPPKTMAYYVGRQLRVTGVVEKTQADFLLNVTTAEVR